MAARRRSRIGRVIVSAIGLALVAAGGVLVYLSLTAPQTVEQAYGRVKSEVIKQVDTVREDVFEELPTVRLGVAGGMTELDWCDGTFTEMLSYERDEVPPVWAAHNNCSGDAILPWELGQHVRVEGQDQVFEVVDIRPVPKTWSTTEDLVGLGGEFALQTCFYGEDRMKFVGLAPVA